MSGSPLIVSRTPDSPKNMQQCFSIEKNVTLRIQLSSLDALRDINNAKDLQVGIDCQTLIDRGTQTTGEESDLYLVKEQLRNTENKIAYLADRVKTYRDRWLEEYYRAENLEYHMPSGIHIADIPQIPAGAPSPSFFPEYWVLSATRNHFTGVQIVVNLCLFQNEFSIGIVDAVAGPEDLGFILQDIVEKQLIAKIIMEIYHDRLKALPGITI
ncbi:hypothetical protein DEU56DRAFT_912144 [Suillus clintonianus]|uniref:uncharacterized protein n=1 Tax=Suillus clintonianus TaxID=1904413 RepID=UPI001B876F3D|nr:uncharacterized protein DEU56DRAFT_912144 [Suillus clintonianus]KAG2139301.1 hypothetical protein DEU56DRAFT_912144 [Suillus clintonianus]